MVVLGFPGINQPSDFIPTPVYTRIVSIPGEEVEIPFTQSRKYKGKYYILATAVYPGHSGGMVIAQKHIQSRGKPNALPPEKDFVIAMVFGGLGVDSPFSFALSSDYIVELLEDFHWRVLKRE